MSRDSLHMRAAVDQARQARLGHAAEVLIFGGRCEWFAHCAEQASVSVPHPVLVVVPACADCAKRAGGAA